MKALLQAAEEQDIPALLAMMEDFYRIDGYPFKEERTLRNLHLFLARPDWGRIWLLVNEGQVLGYLVLCLGFSFEFGGRDAFLDELYLKPAHRGQGWAKKALAELMPQAEALEVVALHLEVERHNEAGKKLYRHFGFEDHDRILMTRYQHPSARDSA
ncbi:MAG: hypothetical protein OHK0053_27990 [Microscillaceae bacterium]